MFQLQHIWRWFHADNRKITIMQNKHCVPLASLTAVKFFRLRQLNQHDPNHNFLFFYEIVKYISVVHVHSICPASEDHRQYIRSFCLSTYNCINLNFVKCCELKQSNAVKGHRTTFELCWCNPRHYTVNITV